MFNKGNFIGDKEKMYDFTSTYKCVKMKTRKQNLKIKSLLKF